MFRGPDMMRFKVAESGCNAGFASGANCYAIRVPIQGSKLAQQIKDDRLVVVGERI